MSRISYVLEIERIRISYVLEIERIILLLIIATHGKNSQSNLPRNLQFPHVYLCDLPGLVEG